ILPQGHHRIARAIGRIENRYKLAKLFDITVGEYGFTFARSPLRIAEEARLDGFYVIRTSVEDKALAAESRLAPILVKGLQYQLDARIERDEFVGPGADRRFFEPIVADFVDLFLWHDTA